MPSIVVEVSDEIDRHWRGLAEGLSVPVETWLGLCGLWGAALDLPISRVVLRQPPAARALMGVAWEVGEFPNLTCPTRTQKGGAALINKAILVGNVGCDPQVRSTPAGLPVASFSLATHRRFRDSGGNRREHTEWHTVVCFGRLAQAVAQYLKRGRQAYVEGRLKTRSWEDQQTGERRTRTEIVCESIQMLGTRGEISEEASSAPSEDDFGEPGTGTDDVAAADPAGF